MLISTLPHGLMNIPSKNFNWLSLNIAADFTVSMIYSSSTSSRENDLSACWERDCSCFAMIGGRATNPVASRPEKKG